MIFYPPTTLLPPSPPYSSLDEIIAALCDRCLVLAEDKAFPAAEITQYFEFTMSVIDFWYAELEQEFPL